MKDKRAGFGIAFFQLKPDIRAVFGRHPGDVEHIVGGRDDIYIDPDFFTGSPPQPGRLWLDKGGPDDIAGKA